MSGHTHIFSPVTRACACGADELSAKINAGCEFQPFQVNEKEHLVGKLRGRKDSLVSYIFTAIAVEDWHAVADAACDLREIDAKLEMLK